MLTDYAKAHMILVEIDRRFENLMTRRPKIDKHAIRMARIEGQFQNRMYPIDAQAFDYYVHGRLP